MIVAEVGLAEVGLTEVRLAGVGLAEVVFAIEVALDDPDGPDDALPHKDAELDVLSEPVLRVTRSVPGANEKVYAVKGQAKLVVEFDVNEDEGDGWLVLVADPVFRVTRSVPGAKEKE